MKRIDGINVIPFIDIMLVLLAIVLTTATFIVEGRLEIRLPEDFSLPRRRVVFVFRMGEKNLPGVRPFPDQVGI